jgi:hypothetical protein
MRARISRSPARSAACRRGGRRSRRARSARPPRASAGPGARVGPVPRRGDRRRAGGVGAVAIAASRPAADRCPRGTACRTRGRSSGRPRGARATSVGTSMNITRRIRSPCSARVVSRAVAWPTVRGKPSRIAPRAACGRPSSSMNMPIVSRPARARRAPCTPAPPRRAACRRPSPRGTGCPTRGAGCRARSRGSRPGSPCRRRRRRRAAGSGARHRSGSRGPSVNG